MRKEGNAGRKRKVCEWKEKRRKKMKVSLVIMNRKKLYTRNKKRKERKETDQEKERKRERVRLWGRQGIIGWCIIMSCHETKCDGITFVESLPLSLLDANAVLRVCQTVADYLWWKKRNQNIQDTWNEHHNGVAVWNRLLIPVRVFTMMTPNRNREREKKYRQSERERERENELVNHLCMDCLLICDNHTYQKFPQINCSSRQNSCLPTKTSCNLLLATTRLSSIQVLFSNSHPS